MLSIHFHCDRCSAEIALQASFTSNRRASTPTQSPVIGTFCDESAPMYLSLYPGAFVVSLESAYCSISCSHWRFLPFTSPIHLVHPKRPPQNSPDGCTRLILLLSLHEKHARVYSPAPSSTAPSDPFSSRSRRRNTHILACFILANCPRACTAEGEYMRVWVLVGSFRLFHSHLFTISSVL